MLAVLHPTQTGATVVTGSARLRIIREHLTDSRKIIEVSDTLRFAPSAKGISGDAEEVRFGAAGESRPRHGLTLRGRKIECFSDALENVALGNAARVAFVDCRP